MDNLVIPLKGNHIRRVTVKGGSSSAYHNIQRTASELVLKKDWYSYEWIFCCIRPKELGAGFKTDWIVYYVNMELFDKKIKKETEKIKSNNKMSFINWFNILKNGKQ